MVLTGTRKRPPSCFVIIGPFADERPQERELAVGDLEPAREQDLALLEARRDVLDEARQLSTRSSIRSAAE
jgi:hypothetical protein